MLFRRVVWIPGFPSGSAHVLQICNKIQSPCTGSVEDVLFTYIAEKLLALELAWVLALELAWVLAMELAWVLV